MPATPPLRMLKGLASAPMEASPDHCSRSRNFVARGGRLQVRPGMRFLQAVGKVETDPAPRYAISTAEPTTVTATLGGTGNGQYLWIGFTARPVRFSLAIDLTCQSWPSQALFTGAVRTASQLEYAAWNGTAWASVGVADVFAGTPTAPTPFMSALSNFGAGETQTFSAMVDPLATWATKTIDGATRYWLRIRTPMFETLGQDTIEVPAGAVTYTTTENRVKCLVPFRDRAGAPHLFVAYQYGDDDVEMRYELDGVSLSIGDALQPDGAARVFSRGQMVTAFYHRSTDRVIGCIDGFNWFYLVPSEASIFALIPDDEAIDTPYKGLVDGLRSALPTGPCAAIYDDRLFVLQDNVLYYSSPGVFADIWSNGWEIPLGDGGGPGTGLCVVGGVLAVFKRNSIYVVQAAGGEDAYSAFQIPGNIGCVSSRGAYANDNVAWFPAEDGIYTFNGAELAKVSDVIDAYWGDEVVDAGLGQSIGIVTTESDEYRLFMPSVGGDPWTGDSALYTSFRDQSESFWPQAPDADGYGFQATAVAADQVKKRERILLGDRYGCIWEMDQGRYDGPQRVTAEITSARVNVGTGAKALARWVTPTVRAETNETLEAGVYPDDRVATEQAVNFDIRGDNPAAAYADTTTVIAAPDTVPYLFDVQTLASGSFEVKGRFFRARLAASAPFAMEAVEMEFNLDGRRG